MPVADPLLHRLKLFRHRIEGAREALLKSERERFLREEWPVLFARLQRLGLDLKTLMRETGTDKREGHIDQEQQS